LSADRNYTWDEVENEWLRGGYIGVVPDEVIAGSISLSRFSVELGWRGVAAIVGRLCTVLSLRYGW
jgi:hypothetical protein